jgi:hypothetical protein
MTRLALGIMPGMRAASGFNAALAMSCSARAPKPQAVRWRSWRRVNVFMGLLSNGVIGSVFDVNEGLQRLDVKLNWKHDDRENIDP